MRYLQLNFVNMFIDVYKRQDTGYVIAFYLPEQVGAKNVSTGLYAVTGTPFKTFTI